MIQTCFRALILPQGLLEFGRPLPLLRKGGAEAFGDEVPVAYGAAFGQESVVGAGQFRILRASWRIQSSASSVFSSL